MTWCTHSSTLTKRAGCVNKVKLSLPLKRGQGHSWDSGKSHMTLIFRPVLDFYPNEPFKLHVRIMNIYIILIKIKLKAQFLHWKLEKKLQEVSVPAKSIYNWIVLIPMEMYRFIFLVLFNSLYEIFVVNNVSRIKSSVCYMDSLWCVCVYLFYPIYLHRGQKNQ